MKKNIFMTLTILCIFQSAHSSDKAYDSDDDYYMNKKHVALVRHGSSFIDQGFLELRCAYDVGIGTPHITTQCIITGSAKFTYGLAQMTTGLVLDGSQQIYTYAQKNPKKTVLAGITLATIGSLYALS